MTRLPEALLLAAFLAAPLGACSRASAPDIPFEATRTLAAEEPTTEALARETCTEEARRKGISSVTRILLLRGKISESDYVECMEAKGFVKAER